MISKGFPVLSETYTSDGTVLKHRFIGADGAYATAGGNAVGVSDIDAISVSQPDISLISIGVTKVTAGAAFAKGAAIEVGTDGKAVGNTTGVVVGCAREAGVTDQDTLIFLIGNA